ncbi:MAG TPA: DNA replication/repair protein RecF [Alphaproteobacteria bacterium]|nr:DNA replication/repair protein RecF [Alphaproteobacteria bacterium]HNS44913.1 DNA replication/repair protein RecF [Alphaproteobacteria bacterium]
MTFISDIILRNFRSYTEAGLHGLASSFVVLTGPNGAGKTNILEAISLLSPGKGMRNADLPDLQSRKTSDPWTISAKVTTQFGPIQVGTSKDPQKNKRIVHIQGEQAKSQTLLSEYFSCLWLTPQMDRLFIDASSARRRFLDRMVFSFDGGHAGRITRYENALVQRSKLLKDGNANPVWLDSLETQMAESGVAVAAARNDFVERLQKVCDRRPSENFPRAALTLKGFLEEGLRKDKALEIEIRFKSELKSRRDEDALTGGSVIGAHRTDFDVTYAAKNMPAHDCSTGEQKALLIGIVLAHADLINAEHGAPPLLLLDEVAAHLDPARRHALYDLLSHIGGQVWMTGTEPEIFAGVPENSSFFDICAEKITEK